MIILAAGLSKRMGYPKPFLKFDLQHTFLEHLILLYQKLPISKVVVVLNAAHRSYLDSAFVAKENVCFIFNEVPEKGRLHSLKLGLCAVKDNSATVIQNIDNPLVHISTVQKILSYCFSENCVIPTYQKKGGHPILLSQSVFDKISAAPESATLRDILLYEKKYYVETFDKGILININTQEDYQQHFLR